MGGLALKKTFTRRYNRDEFDIIVPELIEKLKVKFDDVKSTLFYKEKETFGDADLLCLLREGEDYSKLKEWLYEVMGANEVYANNGVYSFDYKELQVDLILTPRKNWESSYTYFSYNDLHNLVGKLAKKFNLKWGFDGLNYVYRIEGKVLGEIEVCKDHRVVLPFLGLSAERYDQGFDKLIDIFEYVKSSKYFSPFMFDLELFNRINRERDRKRKTYSDFLEWLEPMKQSSTPDDWHYFYHDKKAYLGHIDNYFPGFLRKFRELEKEEERKVKVKSIFNGNIIMEYFDISGAQLGQALGKFENHFGSKQAMEEWILYWGSTEETLKLFASVCELEFNT